MISATVQLDTWLRANRTGRSTPVITIALATSSTVLRWARRQADVVYGGTTWNAHGGTRPMVSGYRVRSPLGLEETSTCEMTLAVDETMLLDGVPISVAAMRGAFREASLLLERVYADEAGTYQGKLFRFYGFITRCEPQTGQLVVYAESPSARLKSTLMPRTLLSQTCTNALFDTACELTRATWTTNTTVLAGSTARVLNVSGTWANGYWDLGSIALGTGASLTPITARRGIRSSVDNALTLAVPLAAAPAPGTAIALTLGCDRTLSLTTGCRRFDNLIHFRAEPALPREG